MTGRALIVEDSPTQAARLRRLLEQNDWHVQMARNGVEGLAACRAQPPDVVLSDILMPEMDGFELCRKLAEVSPSVPVVLLTSLTAPLDVVRALAAGAANYVTKPYEDDELLARLNRTVRRARGERVFEVLGERLDLSADPVRVLDVLVSTLEDARRRVDDLESAHRALMASEGENRRLYEDALRSSRAKDDFLAVVSHELRTPLNAIGGWARLLRDGMLDEEKKARALDVITRNVDAQARLIDDVLDVSRIISGKLTLDPKLVAIGPLVASVVSSFEPSAHAAGSSLELTNDIDQELVLGDSDRLTQVLTNLIGNAIKFTPRGGHVRVRAQRQDTSVQLFVTDDGVGIDPEFLPYVFDQFQQADTSRSRRHGGLGLGLAIARHLVELHHGKISAQSAGPGQGATFHIQLPLATENGAPERPSEAAGKSQRSDMPLAGLRVLAVDDHADARELLALTLAASGADAVVAENAAAAWDALHDGSYDVLVSDIGMPGEDGLQLMQRVRTNPAWEHLASVALTAFAGRQAEQEALSAGFDAYVAKPIPAVQLVEAVRRALRRGA
jgi:signal transduction histidine kinase